MVLVSYVILVLGIKFPFSNFFNNFPIICNCECPKFVYFELRVSYFSEQSCCWTLWKDNLAHASREQVALKELIDALVGLHGKIESKSFLIF